MKSLQPKLRSVTPSSPPLLYLNNKQILQSPISLIDCSSKPSKASFNPVHNSLPCCHSRWLQNSTRSSPSRTPAGKTLLNHRSASDLVANSLILPPSCFDLDHSPAISNMFAYSNSPRPAHSLIWSYFHEFPLFRNQETNKEVEKERKISPPHLKVCATWAVIDLNCTSKNKSRKILHPKLKCSFALFNIMGKIASSIYLHCSNAAGKIF